MTDEAPPPGFSPCVVRSAYTCALGPLFQRVDKGFGRTIGITVAPSHCNAMGVAHGGFLLTLMDFAMSYGGESDDDFPPGITLSLTTNFMRGAPLGAWIEAKVTVERAGKSALFNRCLITHGADLIASAQGVFKPTTLAPLRD